jgi:hypothetical protein
MNKKEKFPVIKYIDRPLVDIFNGDAEYREIMIKAKVDKILGKCQINDKEMYTILQKGTGNNISLKFFDDLFKFIALKRDYEYALSVFTEVEQIDE